MDLLDPVTVRGLMHWNIPVPRKSTGTLSALSSTTIVLRSVLAHTSKMARDLMAEKDEKWPTKSPLIFVEQVVPMH